ncbi:MAG: S-methyl-5'-thioinosine phosphorylase [Wenzhouxiangella sp.]|nr:S-methyl-5'-thioinosine phosphorylase [Wenzhouxiangella sp.]TVR99144.1 MAG: S-methyl-5'-thioinosine phosphorylase [Wenzhouxiangellaceae bacterium]
MSLAIIGGTGSLDLFEVIERREVKTTWGDPSAPLARIQLAAGSAWFLPRHGQPHHIPPHRVNYRANIQALSDLGVSRILAITAVGGIDPGLAPGALVVPDQLIDYTWGRVHSFSDDAESPLRHVEFANPFSAVLRQTLLGAADRAGLAVVDGGCYAVTQGPRLETAAEISKLARDGCSLVGMTAMPEAALARELDLAYAMLCVVANPAAGVSDKAISVDEIHVVLDRSMVQVRALFNALEA